MSNTVLITIGVTDVSADVLELDTWGNRLTNIGLCRLRIDNLANKYGGLLGANNVIEIWINGVQIWEGKVDNVMPYLPVKGYAINELLVTGRDYGRYLRDYYDTGDYGEQASGVTIDEILANQGDPLLYTDPGGTPTIKYDTKRTWLADAFNEIAEEVGWCYYIDITGRLHYIDVAVGEDTTIDLISDPATPLSNNLLNFTEYETIAFDIKNTIEIYAGSVRGHYNDLNAADWDKTGGAVTDETTIKMMGAGSTKLVAGDNDETVWLDFSGAGLYSHVNLDLTKFATCKACIRPGAGSTGNFTFRPYLKDTGNREIWFTRNKEGQSDKSFTEDLDGSQIRWLAMSFPVGDHTGNPTYVNKKNGYWHGVADGTFDWANVKYFGFQVITTGAMDTLYIDALSIPPVEAVSRATNVVAGTDTRMYKEYRKDIGSQKRLDAYCAKVLELKRVVVQKFKAVARGQTGTKYVSQYVHIRAPGYGVAALTRYDIVAIHHKLHHGSDVRGFEYITEYDLVPAESQDIRVLGSDNYRAAQLRELARINRILDGAVMEDEYWLGGVQTGITPQIKRGTPFPLDMNDGDEFFLTADLTVGANEYYGPALYKYDDLAVDWIRNPITMHRTAGTFPAANGEVHEDTLHRTDTDLWYRWDSGVPGWVLIEFAATSISGEVSSTQLKKGIQKFDSNVLVEAIRAVATSTVTFDVDVDDGTGKAEITASAGTPFSDFTVGDELVIQSAENPLHNTTARTVQAVNVGGQGITLDNVLADVDNADDEMMIVSVADGLKWTGDTPAVWFSDGTTQNIANGTVQGLAPATYWVIFTVGGAVSLTSSYANAVGDTVGIIARVTIAFGREPFIFPVFTRGGSQTLDFLGAGVIDTIMLTGEALIGKIMKSADGVDWADGAGDPGTIMTRYGIKGKGAAGVTQFALSSVDGKVYAGAGAVILDVDGLSTDGKISIKTAAGVQWAAGGNPGVILTDTGLRGKGAAGVLTSEILAATGVMTVYGSGMFELRKADLTLVGSIDMTTYDLGMGVGNQDVFMMHTPATKLLVLRGGVNFFALDETTNRIVLDNAWASMVPQTDGSVDLGTNLLQFGDIWGIPKYADLNLLDTHCPRCDERFKFHEDIKFVIIAVETLDGAEGTTYEQIRCIPVHARCSPWARIKKWMRRNN